MQAATQDDGRRSVASKATKAAANPALREADWTAPVVPYADLGAKLSSGVASGVVLVDTAEDSDAACDMIHGVKLAECARAVILCPQGRGLPVAADDRVRVLHTTLVPAAADVPSARPTLKASPQKVALKIPAAESKISVVRFAWDRRYATDGASERTSLASSP